MCFKELDTLYHDQGFSMEVMDRKRPVNRTETENPVFRPFFKLTETEP